jgi:hypothetical protein
MNKIWLLVVGWLLVVSCDKDTTIIDEKIGIADKIKEIAHKKDSVIANRDSVIVYLNQIIAVQQDEIEKLNKAEYIEDFSENIGENYNGYTLVVKVTKDDRYEKYPNKVHGEVMIKDKVFHHYTIYSADCSVQKAMFDVRMNLRKWVDK